MRRRGLALGVALLAGCASSGEVPTTTPPTTTPATTAPITSTTTATTAPVTIPAVSTPTVSTPAVSSPAVSIPLVVVTPPLAAPGTLAASIASGWALVAPAALGGDLAVGEAPRIDQQLIWRIENGKVVFRLLGFVPRPTGEVAQVYREAALGSGWAEQVWSPDAASARYSGRFQRDGVTLAVVLFPSGAATSQIQLVAQTEDLSRAPAAAAFSLPAGLGLPEGATVTGIDLRPSQGRPTSTLTFTAPYPREAVLGGYATVLRAAGWDVSGDASVTATSKGVEVRVLAGPQPTGSAVTLTVVGPATAA